MPRVLTFDEKTASLLRRQFPSEQVFEHRAKGAVEYALGSDRTLVTVIPTEAEREAAIAVFRWPKQAVNAAPNVQERKPVASVQIPLKNDAAIRAGGFLGLWDEPVFEEEEPAPPKKQSWWRKFWPEDE